MTVTDMDLANIDAAERNVLPQLADHHMTVVHDTGALRHLQFRGTGRHAAWLYAFDLVTWPQHIAISGDMGDMTMSISEPDALAWAAGRGARPSFDYWREKVVATPREGLVEFSRRTFLDVVREQRPDLLGDTAEVESLQEAFEWLWANDVTIDGDADVQELTFRAAALMFAVRHGANLYAATRQGHSHG